LPGHDWFLEHVHPTDRGYALIGRTYAEAMRAATRALRQDSSRIRSWADYDRGRALSSFDLQIGELQRRTLVLRWPFVPADSQRDFRADYTPADLRDSAAFAVIRGAPWEVVKVQYAEELERRRQVDSAVFEYRGLARDAPMFETPHRLLGRALMASGQYEEAEEPLRRAMAILPTGAAAHSLAKVLLRKRALKEAIQLLELAQRAEPNRADVIYELALARGMNNDIAGARAATLRLSQVAPNHPGLPDLVRALGGAAPTSPRRAP
jgi:tetratricopeptide (TPR) repeat protein